MILDNETSIKAKLFEDLRELDFKNATDRSSLAYTLYDKKSDIKLYILQDDRINRDNTEDDKFILVSNRCDELHFSENQDFLLIHCICGLKRDQSSILYREILSFLEENEANEFIRDFIEHFIDNVIHIDRDALNIFLLVCRGVELQVASDIVQLLEYTSKNQNSTLSKFIKEYK